MASGKIFISYRREDTSGESGRLKDKLEQVFGQENIFYDVETLEAGLNFDQSIAKALGESKVLLAMIGPHWLKVVDSKGISRLQKPDDWVRKEIAEALQRDLRVIPVLVNGAEMPDQVDLPDELQALSLKHAQELSSSRWNYDVGELTKVLEKLIAKKPNPKPRPNPAPAPRPKGWWAKNYLWVLGGLVVTFGLVGMCTSEYGDNYDNSIPSEVTNAVADNPEDQRDNPDGGEIYESSTLADPTNESNPESPAELASISLIYRGDNFGCGLNIEVTIGGKKYIPTGSQYIISGLELGTLDYSIDGQINCPAVGSCKAMGSGTIEVQPNANYFVVWNTTSQGHCTILLQKQ